jgi:ribosome-binding ATPase YchF (GTP1/OBG family)
MKIGFTGIELTEGKVKYRDPKLIALADKDKPKKISPFFAEFIKDELVQCDLITVPAENLLDVLIEDMDKLETRLSRLQEDDADAILFRRCMKELENNIPLSEMQFTEEEISVVQSVSPVTLKPVLTIHGEEEQNEIIEKALEKAGYMFFYTTGPKESHAWLVGKDATILECAGKIHSDLARGFIRGEVVSFDDYLGCHNFNECRSKGLSRVVERDYVVQPGEIIEIRFSV